jgi:hypothetical protein
MASDPYAYFKDAEADPYAQFVDAPGQKAMQPQFPSVWMSPVGGAEMLLKRATGALGAIPAGVAYGGAAVGKALGADVNPADVQRRLQDYLTYQPVSASGQAGEQELSNLLRPVGQAVSQAGNRLATSVGQVSPTAETYLREAPSALQAAGAVMPLAGTVTNLASSTANTARNAAAAVQRRFAAPPSVQDVLARSYTNTPQSMGAAAAAPSMSDVSPELRQAISTAAQQTGGAVNPDILNRHVQADSLPVKMQLTAGQASQDPTLISQEANLRGKYKPLADRMNAQNQQLIDNLQALRDQVGPDVFSTNPEEHANTIIEAYQAKDKAARGAIDQAYDAARQALPANTPVLDGKQLFNNVNSVLADRWATESAPPDIMRRLNTIADGNGVITAGQFEGLRTRLAELARSNDGSTRYASHLIRGVVEDSDLLPGTQGFKAPFDQARSLARQRFQALEADPAYNAAVNDTVAPNRFINRFVVNAPGDDVAAMRANLSDSPAALQTMSVAALEKLRDAARIRDNWTGNFSQDGFNRALQNLSPKIRSLVDPATAETLGNLGDVARYTQFQPRGSFVNNSNTAVAQMADYGAGALEGAVNVAAHGVPVGTWGRNVLQRASTGQMVKQSLAPGAGLTRLNLALATQPAGAAPVRGLSGFMRNP